jgi:signal transduction histidine kinase
MGAGDGAPPGRRAVEAELMVRARQQAAAAELGRRALVDPDVGALMGAAVAVVARTLGVEHAQVLELDPDGATLLVRAAVGRGADGAGRLRVGAGPETQAGYTLASRSPVVVEDLARETRFRLPSVPGSGVVSGISVMIRGEGPAYGVLAADTARARHFDPDDVLFMRATANVLADAVVRARVEERLAVRARQQAAVVELGRQALAGTGIGELLEAAASAVAGALAVECAVVVETRLSGVAVLRAGAGCGNGGVGQVVDPDPPSLPPFLVERGMVSGTAVSIPGGERDWGFLGAYSARPRQFDGGDSALLTAVANVLAQAIQREHADSGLRLAHATEHQLRLRLERHTRLVVDAQEVERRRIARELHDEVGQLLTGLKLSLVGADALPPPRRAERLAGAVALVDELLTRVHDLSLDLRPAVLDDLGLASALAWLVGRYTARTGVEVDLEQSGLGRRLRPEVETAGYRIVQEALTNVARHAATTRARVRCAVHDAALRIEVTDRGRGFDLVAARARDHGGLAGMEERARSVGGQLVVDSAVGRGTSVVAELPLSPGLVP